MVAADLRRRGHRVLFPYGEDSDYDLVAERPDGRFERVQVKYTTSDGAVVVVRCPRAAGGASASASPRTI